MYERVRLLAAFVLVTALATAGSTILGSPAGAATGTSVQVHGRLLVTAVDVPGEHPSYAVALPGGDIVPVRGDFAADARTGDVFDGRLGLPSSVVATLNRRAESGSAAALRLVDSRSLTLPVVGTPSVTAAATAKDVAPTTHQQYVAAVDNLGPLQTDGELLAHVSAVGDYWTGESNGAIAGITVPGTITHYDTALSTTDCGLGSDFFSVVQEAEHQFPSLDLSQNSPDQLVLFVPASCATGGVVGEGTVGSSFASGGALIVEATAAIEGTYAHESGHNYGFEHADARVGTRSLEYYGAYDVMGFALPGYNQLTALSTPFRVFQGITDPGEIQNVSLGKGNLRVHATATIKPRSDDSGVRSVRVKDPDTGEELYLDYRSGTGQDAGSFYGGSHTLGYDAGGQLHYGPGVTVNAVHDGSGNDVMADATGDTSFGAGSSWSDASGRLTVTVTSVSPAGAGVRVDYRPAKELVSSKPTITGSAKVGRTLRAKHHHWTSGTTFSYRWYADGTRLKHETSRKLTLTKARRGSRITVEVTGSKPGYPTVSRTSARTKKVR
jgi:hypothetical protein